MAAQPDFINVLELFNSHKVDFIIVAGKFGDVPVHILAANNSLQTNGRSTEKKIWRILKP